MSSGVNYFPSFNLFAYRKDSLNIKAQPITLVSCQASISACLSLHDLVHTILYAVNWSYEPPFLYDDVISYHIKMEGR